MPNLSYRKPNPNQRIYSSGAFKKYPIQNDRRSQLEDRYADYYGEDSLVAQQLLNQYNNESATAQERFQLYMSDSAHQREVKDLIAAGLNPQLSANAGAPSMVGALAGVDSSPTNAAATRRIQLELQKNDLANQQSLNKQNLENQQLLNKQQLENALLINKYSVDKSFELGKYQAQVGAAATRDAASMAAAASMYNGSMSAAAQRYAADMALLNNREQRSYDNLHPSNAWQAGGSALSFLNGIFSGNSGNTVRNYGNNSTAK